jgi:hypothetical protein
MYLIICFPDIGFMLSNSCQRDVKARLYERRIYKWLGSHRKKKKLINDIQ